MTTEPPISSSNAAVVAVVRSGSDFRRAARLLHASCKTGWTAESEWWNRIGGWVGTPPTFVGEGSCRRRPWRTTNRGNEGRSRSTNRSDRRSTGSSTVGVDEGFRPTRRSTPAWSVSWRRTIGRASFRSRALVGCRDPWSSLPIGSSSPVVCNKYTIQYHTRIFTCDCDNLISVSRDKTRTYKRTNDSIVRNIERMNDRTQGTVKKRRNDGIKTRMNEEFRTNHWNLRSVCFHWVDSCITVNFEIKLCTSLIYFFTFVVKVLWGWYQELGITPWEPIGNCMGAVQPITSTV